ncbi:beta-galactosidase [Mucilaginibacter yixingensis]|uniref:beta-galactosidase n=1 Tax=Mucilaginibacter yixingensis TaxID=1295612 RepID=A0A2T5JFG7_9SPHI|nr:glycoside hydrolase family 2 TIM barrel-domain containing protein [Mucilaginibacter yixingensis]PTR01159.1 beta-galactosidase [Mucilaginibacter yixingensis]
MRSIFTICSLLLALHSYALKPADTIPDKTLPPEIENPECIGIDKQPAHAVLMPYANLKEALAGNRLASSYCMSLNGKWKFHWASWPKYRPIDFYKPSYDVSGWAEIPVPSNWQIQGYGIPFYRNIGYTFQRDYPHVMSTPPTNYTAYKDRDPVGSYRRDFYVPQTWNGGRIFVRFDGVDAGFFLWINGQKVGYSVNSRNAAEFDITKYLQKGKNTIAAEVYQYTSGSYLEDQDQWRLSGIFRNVTLWRAPQQHIRDFFIRTDLDAHYKDATANISAKVINYDSETAGAAIAVACIYKDGQLIASQQTNVPALKAGEETNVSLQIPVKNPLKWTAETPNLYTTVITLQRGQKTIETISAKTGFRKIEIKGRLFLVNGVPIKLKGVNRHENWPEVGHAITEQQMIRDIEVIKQGNCNHVRTCHYSDDPRWYELCDEYGLYVLAEANLECHGLMNRFNDEPTIKAAIIDRNVANVESFKNHPSVIIWSLGNECGTGGSNFRAALQAVKNIDSSRPTHYEGFGIGAVNPADLDSRMYSPLIPNDYPGADAKRRALRPVAESATDTSLKKPFYLCEFAHAMFNSMGSLKEYNDLFDKYPSILGGAIWEFQDQGIWNRRDPKHPILAFGGGFGEFPNDHYFIHKGVVASDRSPKPHYAEMKRVFQWISTTPVDLTKGRFSVKNKYQFIDLSRFSGMWTISKNGVNIDSGRFEPGNVAPHSTQTISIAYRKTLLKPGAEYLLHISYRLKQNTLWAKAGYEIAAEQFELPVQHALPVAHNGGQLNYTDNDGTITVNGGGFSVVFDKQAGTLSSLKTNGHELLQTDGGPRLHLWRAPHQQDDLYAYKVWDSLGVTHLTWTAQMVQVKQPDNHTVSITTALKGTGQAGFVVNHTATYTIYGDGSIRVQNHVSSKDSDMVIARLGVRMLLDQGLENFRYLGRGPMENYPDRKTGSDVALYTSTVTNQLTPYEKPMECGNHEDVRWAALSNKALGTLKVAGDQLLQVSALPYTDEQMNATEYRIDLPKRNATVLCVSAKTLGVGSHSCGPMPLPKYEPLLHEADFAYTISLSK